MANRDLTPWRSGGALGSPGWDPFTSFRREMDRLFDDFFTPAEPRSFAGGQTARMWPSIDVDESPDAYKVTAELPGIDPKDVNIELKDNVLTLSGEKREEKKEGEEGGQRYYAERTWGRFQRSIPLPSEVDPDQCDASFRDGLLSVTLRKNPKARDQARRIEVRPHGQGQSGSEAQAGQASGQPGSSSPSPG
jgi:HSP20 family protein